MSLCATICLFKCFIHIWSHPYTAVHKKSSSLTWVLPFLTNSKRHTQNKKSNCSNNPYFIMLTRLPCSHLPNITDHCECSHCSLPLYNRIIEKYQPSHEPVTMSERSKAFTLYWNVGFSHVQCHTKSKRKPRGHGNIFQISSKFIWQISEKNSVKVSAFFYNCDLGWRIKFIQINIT